MPFASLHYRHVQACSDLTCCCVSRASWRDWSSMCTLETFLYECVIVYIKQKQCQASVYSNDSTYMVSVPFITIKCAITHTKAYISEFRLLLCSGPGFNLHECACLVGFLAVADEFLPLDVTHVDAVRHATERAQQSDHLWCTTLPTFPTVKTANQIALT